MIKYITTIILAITALMANPKGENMSNLKEIYLGGGCFWGTQGYFDRIKGVEFTQVGYANGKSKDTSYYEINNTDHAEVVRVKFNANVVDINEILEHYFRIIDPFSINKQGNDIGRQYRTGIYYNDESLKPIIIEFIRAKQAKFDKKIAVEIEPLKNYVEAEEYHQKYLEKNPNGYCHIDLNLANKPLYDESKFKLPSKDELKNTLSDLEYRVTQEKATERPYSSKYDKFDERGIYVDIVSKKPLFSSSDKYDAGCGWPSFTKPITTDATGYNRDLSHGMDRIEVTSRQSGSHLGHVFDDGPSDKGGLRYCINGASLEFIPYDEMDKRGYSEYKVYVK
ncbi:bifunctional (RS)-methionine sulfoxide reductase A/B [Campylobacter lanienae NCTC 13004]|uniref:Peptide methionine sulfoxide reductase MsrA n=1 Tax=Campylobacter lanienae NCTC 13004 TaxID=1031753 RepID=A0A1X9SM06_9BACT|nr:bifunctional (RS)-methionine sulfoxide reductase A/B [Campylobacter lanienae NCTC 13004]